MKRSAPMRRTGFSRRVRPETRARAAQFREAVFTRWGPWCWMHKRHGSRVQAVDPGHIVNRSRMGAALAYGPKDGPVDARLGRPLCRPCHDRQTVNDPAYAFPQWMIDEVIAIHDGYARSKLGTDKGT